MASTVITTNAKTLSRVADALIAHGAGLSKNTILNTLSAAITGPGHDWGYLKNAPGAYVQAGLQEPEVQTEEDQPSKTVWVLQYDERDTWSRGPMIFATKDIALRHVSADHSWWGHPDHPYEDVMAKLADIGEYTFEPEDDGEEYSPYMISLHEISIFDGPLKPSETQDVPDAPRASNSDLVFYGGFTGDLSQSYDWDTLVFENEAALLSYAKKHQLDTAVPEWRNQAVSAQDCKITAEFQPEVWIHDQATVVDCEGPQDWPVEADELDLAQPDLDYLKTSRKAPRWVRDWSGPFTISLTFTRKKHSE